MPINFTFATLPPFQTITSDNQKIISCFIDYTNTPFSSLTARYIEILMTFPDETSVPEYFDFGFGLNNQGKLKFLLKRNDSTYHLYRVNYTIKVYDLNGTNVQTNNNSTSYECNNDSWFALGDIYDYYGIINPSALNCYDATTLQSTDSVNYNTMVNLNTFNMTVNENPYPPPVVSDIPVYFNGTQLEKMYFNGNEVLSAKFNNNTIY